MFFNINAFFQVFRIDYIHSMLNMNFVGVLLPTSVIICHFIVLS